MSSIHCASTQRYYMILFALIAIFQMQVCVMGRTSQTPTAEKNTSAEPNTNFSKALTEAKKEFQKEEQQISNSEETVFPYTPDLTNLDGSTKEKYYATLRSYYDYRMSGYAHRQTLFRWQFVSSIVIFIVVVLLVFLGMYFSWVQFRQSMPKRFTSTKETTDSVAIASRKSQTLDAKGQAVELSSKGKEPSAPPDSSKPDYSSAKIQTVGPVDKVEITTLKASPEGIEISSPVLGVIILIISFLFFYLYLKTVYPINNVF